MAENYVRIPIEGYCKVDNANRTMEALFYNDKKWGKEFIRLDCNNSNCPYTGECYLIKTAFAMED